MEKEIKIYDSIPFNFNIDKPLKIGIDENICLEGEVFETFDKVLKFISKKEAIKHMRNFYKNKR